MQTTTTETRKRPQINDPEILAAAAKKLAPEVLKWLGEGLDYLLELDVEGDLAKVLRYHYSDDGYRLAKSLEDDGYAADSALVEICDNASSLVRDAINEACVKWVNETEQKPWPLESRVTISNAAQYRDVKGVGIVTGNYPEGKSTVMFPESGHVRKGVGCHGYIVEWENIVSAETA